MIEKKFGKFVIIRDIQNLKTRIMKKDTTSHKDAENTLALILPIIIARKDETSPEEVFIGLSGPQQRLNLVIN